MSCVEWLDKKLPPGTFGECEGICEDAGKAGYSRKDLKFARRELGVKTYHQISEDRTISQWFWYREENQT